MGICKNCIHIGDKVTDFDVSDFVCLNENNEIVNHITGKRHPTMCSRNNFYGECLHYTPVVPFEKLTKIKGNLYEAQYDYIYPELYNVSQPILTFLSSSICNGNFVGQNVDYVYSNTSVVLNKISHNRNRLASLSLSIVDNDSIEALLNSDEPQKLELSKTLPFLAVNGINEAGLTATLNFLDYGESTVTVPAKYKKSDVSLSSLIRFILDNFSAAEEAALYIKNYTAVACDRNVQIMLSDGADSYVLSIINNVVSYSEVTYMTNMDMTNGFEITEENTVDKTTVKDYDKGIERYDIISANYETCGSLEGMTDLLYSLVYTNAYKSETSPVWYSEFTGGDLTNKSAEGEFASIIAEEQTKYQNRSTDPDDPAFGTRHTISSCVYDTTSKSLYLSINEETAQNIFSVEI